MSETQTAIILAGGLGSRLRSKVADRPKVLAEVSGRPFLSSILDMLESEGINKVILSVGYLAEQIQAEYGQTYKSIQIQYCQEQKPAGTGGAIKRSLELCTSEYSFVLNGDSISDVSLSEFASALKHSNLPVGVTLAQVNDASRFGTVKIDRDGRVQAFLEKASNQSGLVNSGVYLLPKNCLQHLELAEPFSFEVDILPTLLSSGVYGYVHKGSFIDIGTPQSYDEASKFIEEWRARRSTVPTP